jgi:lipid-binding SYLF domain-containing protein
MNKIFSALAILLALQLPLSGSPQDDVDLAAGIIRDFRHMPERTIPRTVLRHARGVVIMRVAKAGLIFSGKAGKGVVVARTGHGWSGPSFIGTGGVGWGAQIGGEVTDFVFVLNNRDAVRVFSRGGNVTLGADASVAAGPVGRDAQVAIAPKAAIYTYSRTRGLFAGASLEGAVIVTRAGENESYYGHPVTPAQILSGRVQPPRGASNLRAALGR